MKLKFNDFDATTFNFFIFFLKFEYYESKNK